MALVVDRFEFLAREILTTVTAVRDYFALVGVLYSAKRVLSLTWKVYHSFKIHGVSKLTHQDLKYYGPWAVVTGSTHGIGKAFAQELASQGINIIIISLGEADCEKVARKIVVTGCTRGIGENFAKALAQHGLNLILVSRSPSCLHDLAADLEKNFHVQTHIIPVDFNDGRPVYDGIRNELEGKEIGILVNNVGVMYDYPQCFLEVPEEKLWQLVHVNVAAATMMTRMVLPQMVERHKGAIIVVSSGASFLPTPQMTVYSATKAYLDFFSRGLAYEYRDYGIEVQCLLPFYVATRMTRFSSTLSNPSMWIPSATTYVRHALRTLSWSSRTTGYWPHTIQLWLCSFVPERIWLWGSMRLNNALRRQAFQRLRSRSGHKLKALAKSSSGASISPSRDTH